MRIIIAIIISLFILSCAHNKSGLNLPTELDEISWMKYLREARSEKNTCKSAVLEYSDLWLSYKTPGTMNLLPEVDVNVYLSEIKVDLDRSGINVKKECLTSKLIIDLDLLEKSGQGRYYILAARDYISKLSPEAKGRN